jgi:hypothetical protein
MTLEFPSSNLREQWLHHILHEYLRAVGAGQAPDKVEWLRRYPEFASELQAFFTDRAQLDRLARSMEAAGGPGPRLADGKCPSGEHRS